MRSIHLAALVLFISSLPAVEGCSSSPGSQGTTSPGSPGTSASGAADTSGPVDISGTWRLCDVDSEAGHPYYVPQGGEVIQVSVTDGVASAYEIAADGGALSLPASSEVDSGTTSVLLSGPFDPASRVWSAGFLWPHGDGKGGSIPGYPARMTFSADGARFIGMVGTWSGAQENWFGGREDGSFTCENGGQGGGAPDGGAAGGHCTGDVSCGSPPHCVLGCYLMVSVAPGGVDSCGGSPESCDSFVGADSCRQQGCTWSE